MKKSLRSFGVGMSMAIASALAVPSAYAADAATENKAKDTAEKKLAVGDKAPAWKDLEGTDNERHSLGDLADAKAVVVVFTCNHCPVAKAYEDRLAELAADYDDKGVEVVAININNGDSDKLPAMKERAEEKGFKFAYLYDPSQQIGRDFGAAKTPHAFLLDGARNVVYIGSIDDSMKPEKVTKNYMRDAIDAVLAGNKPTVETTNAIGCGIQYE